MTTDKRPTHYNTKPRSLVRGHLRWWRASEYVLTDDHAIRAGSPIQAITVNAREIDWTECLGWSEQIAADAVPPYPTAIKTSMLNWCKRYGVPGILLSLVNEIRLPSNLALEEISDAPGHVLASETQRSYQREGAEWFASDDERPWPHPEWGEAESIDVGPNSFQEGASVGPKDVKLRFSPETLQGYLDSEFEPDRLRTFLPSGLSDCPIPGTAEFWERYHEPVRELLAWSTRLRQLNELQRSNLAAFDREMSRLQSRVALQMGPQVPPVAAASLADAYGYRYLPSRKQCEHCGAEFQSSSFKSRFCSDKCQDVHSS